MDGFVRKGKASVIIDGQFGSTGKGLIAAYVGQTERIDIATTNASANAGHTAVINGRKLVAYHLPMSGIFERAAILYLNAGAIIDPEVLMKEIAQFRDFDVADRLFIHPRAAVIEKCDVEAETDRNSAATRIASTQHGVGAALTRKIKREAQLAEHCEILGSFIRRLDLSAELRQGVRVVVEVPQGFGLGINSGYAYPYCTSREVSVPQALSDAGIHPEYLGQVLMTMRTYPIRVGNIVDNERAEMGDGQPARPITVGWSGPWYPDQQEVTWEEIGVEPEITTVTKRVRRVATFSGLQYKEAIEAIRPTQVFINFVNYFKHPGQLKAMLAVMAQAEMQAELLPPRRYFGVGPEMKDVFGIEDMQALYNAMGWQQS